MHEHESPTNQPPHLNYEDAARYLHLSVRTVRRLVQHRTITFIRFGGQVRFAQRHLDEYIAKCTVDAMPDGGKS
jgi:excisionase family DNA binding protein